MDSRYGLEALFEYATEGILITSEKGEIMRANPAANRMFGYEKDELELQKIEVLIPRRLTEKHIANRESFSHHPSPRSMGAGRDLYGLRKDGTEFPVEVSLSPFTSVDGKKYVIGFVVDITIRKNGELALRTKHEEVQLLYSNLEKKVQERTMVLEEALRELGRSREDLAQALEKEKDLNELKSRFVSMASHEFRTPLTTILSSVSLISKYAEQGEVEKQIKHIGRIKYSITHLTDILNDVLSLSKLEEGKVHISPESFSLKEAIQDAVQELKGLLKEGQEIIEVYSGPEEISSDKKILRHILFNLISNAVKFSPEGKPIEVKVDASNSVFTIRITDHGIGISEEDKKHLFERFFRGTNATNIQGTGLGLNIVARYTELLNGAIDCESILGEGATFLVRLPFVFDEPNDNIRFFNLSNPRHD
jgi:PAS domain S-box-containing protein